MNEIDFDANRNEWLVKLKVEVQKRQTKVGQIVY